MSAAPLIPRFVTALNRIAENAGFSTTVGIDQIWDDDAPQIVSTWRGTQEALGRLDFLPYTVRARPVMDLATIAWPGFKARAILLGLLERKEDGLELRLSGGPPPEIIRALGDVEISESAGLTTFHGTRHALTAIGIGNEKGFPGFPVKQWARSGSDRGTVLRFPDSSFVYRVTTAAVRWARTPATASWRDEYFGGSGNDSTSIVNPTEGPYRYH